MKQFLSAKKTAAHFFILTNFFLLLCTGCQKYCDHHKHTYTISGEFTTTATFIAAHDTLEETMITGNGTCTPFGNTNFVDTAVGNPLASPEIIKGVETLTASNGDKIFSTINGYSPVPDDNGDFEVFNTNTIIGGTGKYADATGSFKVDAKGNIELPTGTASFNGSITY